MPDNDDRDIMWVNRHYRAGIPFAMISGSRNNKSSTENRISTEELRSELSQYNPVRTVGKGFELDPRTGDEIPCMETSFFVPYYDKDFKSFKHHMLQQAARYHQDWVMISDGKNVIGYAGGSPTVQFHHLILNVDDAKDIWSKIKGRNFAFRESKLSTAAELLERLGV